MRSVRRCLGAFGLVLIALVLIGCGGPEAIDYSGPVAGWDAFGGDAGGLQYSPLTQVTAANVTDLELAWVHKHGDISDGSDGTTRTSYNVAPILVDDTLVVCTGYNRVIAIDAETGAERWAFDPEQRLTKLRGPYPRVCRGVAHWPGNDDPAPCSSRILTATVDSQLIAIDAANGKPCEDFGTHGRVELREGVDGEPWEYYVTAPPLVVGDLVVVGALVSDNLRADAPSGVVRAFDVRSGRLAWAWDPVPPGSERPADAEGYRPGTANVWSIMSADAERDLIFIPTGNAAPDYFAGNRGGLDYYSSATVALRASTGQVVWRRQYVHHDLWDYDTPSQPTLWDFPGPDGPIPVVVQSTKMGHVFILHRETGEPLFPIEERPVPQNGVPLETLSPTQPFPTHVPALHPSSFGPEDAWGFTSYDQGKCAEIIARYRHDGIFTPPTLEGSIQFPGSAGGANWGGVAIDGSGVLFVNQTRMPAVIKLIPRAEYDAMPDKTSTYPAELYPMKGTPYALSRFPLLSPFDAPCNAPPWGTLTAVDLVKGEVLWEVALGTTRDQAPFPMWLSLGAPNLGGPLATAGGLLFIGATTDKFLRAFDVRSGEEIWTQRLPFTANSNPITYRLRPDGKQYVLIAAGGHGWSEPGDALMAFALPD
ncbi:MAG: pyrroloquinoline quinone-dependent dehydrogenase [bacterium]|nr:pyrroloquinoline quinone-dependent dehydrogenase [bacterium]